MSRLDDISGPTHILRRPLLVGKHDPPDDFNAGQTTGFGAFLQLAQNNSVKFLVVHELLDRLALDAVLLGEILERRLGGHDDGDGLVLVGGGVHEEIGDDADGAVDGFELFVARSASVFMYSRGRDTNLFERDILAVERLD